MLSVDVAKALANEKRLQILGWLKSPRAHFPRQVDGDLVRDWQIYIDLAPVFA